MNNMQEFRERLGVAIKEGRANKQWQQDKLAAAVGLKRTSISNIEAGRQSISLEMFCSICEQLALNPAKLIAELTTTATITTTIAPDSVTSIKDRNVREHILKTLSYELKEVK